MARGGRGPRGRLCAGGHGGSIELGDPRRSSSTNAAKSRFRLSPRSPCATQPRRGRSWLIQLAAGSIRTSAIRASSLALAAEPPFRRTRRCPARPSRPGQFRGRSQGGRPFDFCSVCARANRAAVRTAPGCGPGPASRLAINLLAKRCASTAAAKFRLWLSAIGRAPVIKIRERRIRRGRHLLIDDGLGLRESAGGRVGIGHAAVANFRRWKLHPQVDG